MPVYQLRNHIPIAAPARREPADGSESPLRVSLGFEPAWFHRRWGIDFSERWHHDPVYRYQTLARMQAGLSRAFPEVSHWNNGAERDRATLSGVDGAYLVARAFGLRLRYAPDRWPVPEPGQQLTTRQVERLDPDAVLQAPAIEELFGQIESIEKRWGRVYGYPNWQGILNIGFQLRGQEIFLDLHDRPVLADHLFTVIRQVVVRLARKVQRRQRRSGFYTNHFTVSNCTVNMISPAAYRRFILPHDRRIALSFERFGVHTCNWNVTPYLGALAELPRVGYLDMGMESDFVQAKRAFPEARRAVLYSPVKLRTAPADELRADLRRVHRELAPCDVVMADIQAATPDERVKDLLRISAKLEQEAAPYAETVG